MTRRRRRSDAHGGHASHERWLVSYADFITLLFAFFVVLFASSKEDQKKQAQVSQAIDNAFQTLGFFPDRSKKPADLKNVSAISRGVTSRDQPVSAVNVMMGEQIIAPGKVKLDLERLQRELESLLSNQIADHTVAIKMGKDGLVISLREAGFFTSGSAIPHSETLPVLRQMASALRMTPYDLRIEGHTDNVPIHNAEFDSNWELSSARATHLARIFLNTGGIAPQRLSAAGYAEYHPVASNATASGRAENRRVDLVVKPETVTDLSMPNGDRRNSTWQKITQ